MAKKVIAVIIFIVLMAWLGYKMRKDEQGLKQAEREQDSIAAAYFDSLAKR